MILQNYFARIFKDKVKLAICLVLIAIPSLEVIQIILSYNHFGVPLPDPHYVTFLSSTTRQHILQTVLFWFLPIYITLVVAEDSLEDYATGYKNALTSRVGRKKYLSNKLLGAFTLSFLVIFVGLILNFILCKCVFAGGEGFIQADPVEMNSAFYALTMMHPIVTNLVFIITTSLLAGMIGLGSTGLALMLRDRKLVYPTVFAVWFIPFIMKNSIVLALQPFAEYGLNVLLPVYTGVILEYGLIAVIAYIWEAKIATT